MCDYAKVHLSLLLFEFGFIDHAWPNTFELISFSLSNIEHFLRRVEFLCYIYQISFKHRDLDQSWWLTQRGHSWAGSSCSARPTFRWGGRTPGSHPSSNRLCHLNISNGKIITMGNKQSKSLFPVFKMVKFVFV